MVASEWPRALRDGLGIAEKELLASTIGLLTLASEVGASYVWEFTDNTVALSVMRLATAFSPLSQRLAALRADWACEHGVYTSAARITSANNDWADAGSRPSSRGGWRAVERAAIDAGLQFRLVPSIDGPWDDVAWLLSDEGL